MLKPGLDWLEERTGKPVLGVIPYLQQLGIEDEDSASLDSKRAQSRKTLSVSWQTSDQLDIAVIRLPRLSNFTDFDPLQEESDVHFRYIEQLAEWGEPDVVLLPGSKNTMEDLLYLQESGLAATTNFFCPRGKRLDCWYLCGVSDAWCHTFGSWQVRIGSC